MADSSADVDVDADRRNDAPHLEALFLIRFDKKVGYTIAWRRTAGATDLDGVEYKSLPSGLHAVASDLVYFTHEGFAGISAFVRGDAGEAERGAKFVAVGALVRREGAGRLGRGWLLAGRLEKTAQALAEDDGVAPLEELWADRTATGTASGSGTKDDELPADHPARALPTYLDLFGPLVFRLQQAALLRKRILFVGSAPVRTACEFVYNLSLLSTISPRDADRLAPGADDLLRLPALFAVGVHDIPALDAARGPDGWAACTTDDILATKPQLFDIVVDLPRPDAQRPQLRTSAGDVIRASQRDVARFRLLHRELWKHRRGPTLHDGDDGDDSSTDSDAAPLISRDDADAKRADDAFNDACDDAAVEPATWARLAYQGFMWWASAGERDAYTTAETDLDRDLLGDTAAYAHSLETAVVAYFHRQSSLLIDVLAELVDAEADDEDDEALCIDRHDLGRMGLDTWSDADRAYVQEFGSLYFGRRIEVRGTEVDCCGLRVRCDV